MKVVLNDNEKYLFYAALGFLLGVVISSMILLYISNDLKSSYEIKVNDAYIEGFDVGKRKGIEECREIIRDYKPLYNE